MIRNVFIAATVFGVAAASVAAPCARKTTVNDSSYCRCEKLAGDATKVCHGGGLKVYIYSCEGDCPAKESCLKDKNDGERLVITSSPICIRVGAPPNPECAQNSDCTISGWTDTTTIVPKCKCMKC